MSREQYTPPTTTTGAGSSNPGANPAARSNYTSFNLTGASGYEDVTKPVDYLCGDCDAKVSLKRGDPIRCKECGYRVLYKERTKRMIQFEAR